MRQSCARSHYRAHLPPGAPLIALESGRGAVLTRLHQVCTSIVSESRQLEYSEALGLGMESQKAPNTGVVLPMFWAFHVCRSAPGGIRTPDLRYRKPALYPLSYGGEQ